MDDWAVGGLGWRRAVTAHAPQLVTDSFFCVPPANSALRAPQAVVENSHAPRLGCTSGGFAVRRLEIARTALGCTVLRWRARSGGRNGRGDEIADFGGVSGVLRALARAEPILRMLRSLYRILFCIPSANSALRAPQAVVEKSHAPRLGCASGGFARRVVKSRILRSLCEVAEKSLCALLLDCAVRKFVLNKC